MRKQKGPKKSDLIRMAENEIQRAISNLNGATALLSEVIAHYEACKEEFGDILAIKELNPTYFEEISGETKKGT